MKNLLFAEQIPDGLKGGFIPLLAAVCGQDREEPAPLPALSFSRSRVNNRGKVSGARALQFARYQYET